MTEEENWHEGVPQPVDADGNVVPLATRTLYDGDGQEISVMEYALIYSKYTGVPVWHVRKTDGSIFMLDRFHLERPDSWERLEEDIESMLRKSLACYYFGHGQSISCLACPAHTLEKDCKEMATCDILRRIRALREKEREMKTSDDQRREVAANLRLLDDEAQALIKEQMLRFTIEELTENIMFSIGLCAAANEAGLETKTLGDSWDIIADLIDPTCRNLAMKPADEFLCSKCCEHVDIAYMDSCDDYHAKYCPNCGARVVSGDGY